MAKLKIKKNHVIRIYIYIFFEDNLLYNALFLLKGWIFEKYIYFLIFIFKLQSNINYCFLWKKTLEYLKN